MRSHEGQATVEYILILAIAVMVASVVVRKFISPKLEELATRVGDQIESRFFNSKSFHSIRLTR